MICRFVKMLLSLSFICSHSTPAPSSSPLCSPTLSGCPLFTSPHPSDSLLPPPHPPHPRVCVGGTAETSEVFSYFRRCFPPRPLRAARHQGSENRTFQLPRRLCSPASPRCLREAASCSPLNKTQNCGVLFCSICVLRMNVWCQVCDV